MIQDQIQSIALTYLASADFTLNMAQHKCFSNILAVLFRYLGVS